MSTATYAPRRNVLTNYIVKNACDPNNDAAKSFDVATYLTTHYSEAFNLVRELTNLHFSVGCRLSYNEVEDILMDVNNDLQSVGVNLVIVQD